MRPTLQKRSWLNTITLRFVLMMVLVSGLMMLILIGSVSKILYNGIRQEEKRFLEDAAAVLQDILKQRPGVETNVWSEPFIEQLRHELQAVHFSQLELLIETPGHKIILTTPTFAKISAQTLHALFSNRWHYFSSKEPIAFSYNGHDYLLQAEMLSWPNKPPVRFYLVLDVTRNNALIAAFNQQMNGVLVIGLLCILFLSILISITGLWPLRSISQEIASISSQALQGGHPVTLDRPALARELRVMVRSFDTVITHLQRAFQQLSQFSADVAHEFRTPLTNLRGATEVALSQERTPREYQALLSSQLEEYDRLSHMIETLLFLARVEAHEVTLPKTPVNLLEQLDAVIDYFEPMLEEASLEMVHLPCADPPGALTIQGDSALIRRALSNILANAIRHTPPSGRITVGVKRLPSPSNEPENPNDPIVQVCIQDSGCGIAPEHLPFIMNRFYRGDSTRASSSLAFADSHGLGLALVESIMTLHGGALHIESTVGKGTTVVLNFAASALTP
ncbi:MAG: heavy metal sensor histidine kinase [Vampirovibrionales bacterium]|nr:heavy metal sensor histidine kinase [Vampirovibrionales bacterium]